MPPVPHPSEGTPAVPALYIWLRGAASKLAFGVAFGILAFAGTAALWQTYEWQGSSAASTKAFQILASLDKFEWYVDDGVAAGNALLERPGSLAHKNRITENVEGARKSAALLRELTSDEPVLSGYADQLRPAVEAYAAKMQGVTASGTKSMQRPNGTLVPLDFPDDIDELVEAMRIRERAIFESGVIKQQASDLRARQFFLGAIAASLLMAIFSVWRSVWDIRRRHAAEAALRKSEAEYRRVVETATDIIFRTDASGRFTYCNETTLAKLHFTREELIGRSYLKMVRHDKRKEVANFYIRQFARRKENTYYEFPVIDGYGKERWLGQNLQLRIENGEVVGFQAIARDVTKRRQTEAELAMSQAFVERIAATTPGVLYVYDLDERRHVFANREAEIALGLEPGGAERYFERSVDRNHPDRNHPDDRAVLAQHVNNLRHAADGEVQRIEYRVRHSDGHWVWFSSRDTPFERGSDGLVKRIVGIAQDISERRAAQEKLAHQANYDALTNLANRPYFTDQMEQLISRLGTEAGGPSLCLIDLDHFKSVNDRFGHAAGDEVLESLGAIMRSELRSDDIAGRLGGDEFCFLAAHSNTAHASEIAERILERLASQAFGLSVESGPFSVTATVGIADWKPGMTSRELLEAADRALYGGKAAGRNRVFAEV